MKLGSTGMSTSHWCAIVALWFAPGTKEGHGTAQSARTYSFQSRILPTGYKGTYKTRRARANSSSRSIAPTDRPDPAQAEMLALPHWNCGAQFPQPQDPPLRWIWKPAQHVNLLHSAIDHAREAVTPPGPSPLLAMPGQFCWLQWNRGLGFIDIAENQFLC